MNRRVKVLAGAALSTMLLIGGNALAQAYPTKPIKIMVGFGAGTGSDLLARVLATKLSDQLGQSVIVENRPGAGGMVGSDAVAKAPADGYTLLLGTNASLIISPLLHANPPFQVTTDFTPLGSVARTAMVLVTSSASPAPKTLGELSAKIRGGNTSYASTGAGTIGHLSSELMLKNLNTKSTHIPYKGSSQSLTDVIRGEALFAIDTPTAAQALIAGGKLRALAVTGERRVPLLPDTPTFAESGVPYVVVYAWWGLMAPAGTPQPVAQKLIDALGKVLADADIRTRLQSMGLELFTQPTERFASFVKSEYPFWKNFLLQANIKID